MNLIILAIPIVINISIKYPLLLLLLLFQSNPIIIIICQTQLLLLLTSSCFFYSRPIHSFTHIKSFILLKGSQKLSNGFLHSLIKFVTYLAFLTYSLKNIGMMSFNIWNKFGFKGGNFFNIQLV